MPTVVLNGIIDLEAQLLSIALLSVEFMGATIVNLLFFLLQKGAPYVSFSNTVRENRKRETTGENPNY